MEHQDVGCEHLMLGLFSALGASFPTGKAGVTLTPQTCPERSSGEENFPKTKLASPVTSAKTPGGAGGRKRGEAKPDMAHPWGSRRESDSALKN